MWGGEGCVLILRSLLLFGARFCFGVYVYRGVVDVGKGGLIKDTLWHLYVLCYDLLILCVDGVEWWCPERLQPDPFIIHNSSLFAFLPLPPFHIRHHSHHSQPPYSPNLPHTFPPTSPIATKRPSTVSLLVPR